MNSILRIIWTILINNSICVSYNVMLLLTGDAYAPRTLKNPVTARAFTTALQVRTRCILSYAYFRKAFMSVHTYSEEEERSGIWSSPVAFRFNEAVSEVPIVLALPSRIPSPLSYPFSFFPLFLCFSLCFFFFSFFFLNSPSDVLLNFPI